MCKCEKDPMSIVEDTERTRFCPQTDRRTDGRTDRRTDGQGDTSIPPFQLRWSGGYNKDQETHHISVCIKFEEFILIREAMNAEQGHTYVPLELLRRRTKSSSHPGLPG